MSSSSPQAVTPTSEHAERPAKASFKAVHGPPARKERLSAFECRRGAEIAAAASQSSARKKTYISANIAAITSVIALKGAGAEGIGSATSANSLTVKFVLLRG